MDILTCFKAALVYLNITAPPALAINDEMTHPGFYTPSTIMIKSDAPCNVMIHEMVHHKQFSLYGMPKDYEDWFRREIQATRIEAQWFESIN